MFWISRHRRVAYRFPPDCTSRKGCRTPLSMRSPGCALIKSCFLQCEHGHQDTPLVPAPSVPELFGPGTKVGRRVRCTQVLDEASSHVFVGFCLCWELRDKDCPVLPQDFSDSCGWACTEGRQTFGRTRYTRFCISVAHDLQPRACPG